MIRFVRERSQLPFEGSIFATCPLAGHSYCIRSFQVIMMMMMMTPTVSDNDDDDVHYDHNLKDHCLLAVSPPKHEGSASKVFKRLQKHAWGVHHYTFAMSTIVKLSGNPAVKYDFQFSIAGDRGKPSRWAVFINLMLMLIMNNRESDDQVKGTHPQNLFQVFHMSCAPAWKAHEKSNDWNDIHCVLEL